MNKTRTFIIAVVIPLLILSGLTIKPAKTMLLGQEILLQTNAVDPTDLFRGDYIIVNPKIAEVSRSSFPSTMEISGGKNIYVLLKPEGPYHVIDKISITVPQEGLYLKGMIPYYFPESDMVQIDYSLDRYFIKQGSGKELEEASLQGKLIANVKILDGYGILTAVSVAD